SMASAGKMNLDMAHLLRVALHAPVLDYESWDAPKIAYVASNNDSIMFESNRGDFQVHLAHVKFHGNQAVKSLNCGLGIEQYGKPGEVLQGRGQPCVGLGNLDRTAGTPQRSVPACQLLLDCDNAD